MRQPVAAAQPRPGIGPRPGVSQNSDASQNAGVSRNRDAPPSLISRYATTSILCLCLLGTAEVAAQQNGPPKGSSNKAMAAYADAANFQTGGATDLAIEAWKKFLKAYGKDPMASQAAHYLGVCYMQKESPDYDAAAAAFGVALRDRKYDLREESLANRGWCLYAAAGDGQTKDEGKLREALKTFATLRKEKPKSRYLDRALFYSGEAHYGLGQPGDAVKFYDAFLTAAEAKDSPLRCDAFYARGVAQEDLRQYDKAVASYNQLLAGCADKKELVTDVYLRIGDLRVLQEKFDDAVAAFAAAYDSTEVAEDRSYALFRQGYALARAGQPADAASRYEQLLKEFPNSPYNAASTLASAQSSYRSGDLDQAAERFSRVLQQNDAAAATEAAHWLARIEITQGNATKAAAISRQQIKAGAKGDYAMALRLDLAEALSMNDDTVKESLELFEKAYRDSPRDPLAPRALYNAAFSAYQLGDPNKALGLSLTFIKSFPKDTLVSDIRFVAAESQLQVGKKEDAVNTFRKLLSSGDKETVQRPIWVIRAASACNATGRYEDALSVLDADRGRIEGTPQWAEWHFLRGKALVGLGRHKEAARAMKACLEAAPEGKRASEASLMIGQSMSASGDRDAAVAAWEKIVNDSPDTAAADQAHYKLAQLANARDDFASAISHYDNILDSPRDEDLLPYALYGKGWSSLQQNGYEEALPPLDRVLRDFPNHAIRGDALLARGITLRNLDRLDDAKIDLQAFLETSPKESNLGHALYELALIEQKQKAPAKAAERLERLVREVPNYPSMDKVLYELGWSHRESGDEEAAVQRFGLLIDRYRDNPLSAEAAYYVGQKRYRDSDWKEAAEQFRIASRSDDATLSEKARYRMGWSAFKAKDYQTAAEAFKEQAKSHPGGKLHLDALMMVGECHFKRAEFDQALPAYSQAREKIRRANDTADSIRDPAERQVRELILLHGGQSAAQLKQYKAAIDWLDELRERFPATRYLPQAFYETGFAYQQSGDGKNALRFYAEVADNYRNEVAARARFMMGELYFGEREFDKAIPEFQRVMFGFGAEQASEKIKNWQAKSGFEAGRCSELLIQAAPTRRGQDKAKKMAADFFTYVIDKHPTHDLVSQSRERLEAVKQQ